MIREALSAARERPAFALYLLALATLGFKWLSPLSSFQETAGWTDVLVALAAARLGGRARARAQLPEAAAVPPGARALDRAPALLSLAFADAKGTGARNVLLMLELAVLALLTSEFASERRGLRAIVVVIAGVSLSRPPWPRSGWRSSTRARHTSLIGAYGEQFIASDSYARVAAGFASPPLLASFCIFASAVVAREDSPLPARMTTATQVALSAVVLLTFSRGAIAFFMAMGIRAAYRRLGPAAARAWPSGSSWPRVAVLAVLSVGRLHLDPTRPSTISYEVPDPGNRREAFDTGLDTLADHPLTGKGPGTYVSLNRGFPFRAHFTPLNVAATMGPPALAALVFLVVVLWRERRRPTSIATWSGLIALADRRPRAGHRALPARVGDARAGRRRESLQARFASA